MLPTVNTDKVVPAAHSTRTRLLPRLTIDATALYPFPQSAVSASSILSSAAPSVTSSTITMSSEGAFYVRCMYDYKAMDKDQLSFQTDDILEIVRMEESGWWAAINEVDRSVGWVPRAYVEPISEGMADGLRTARNGDGIHIVQSGEDHLNGYTMHIISPSDNYDWLPMIDDADAKQTWAASPDAYLGHHLRRDLPRNVTSPIYSPITSPRHAGYFSPTGQAHFISPTRMLALELCSSPTAPMPQPPIHKDILRLGFRPSTLGHSILVPDTAQPPLASPTQLASPLSKRSSERRPMLISELPSMRKLSIHTEAIWIPRVAVNDSSDSLSLPKEPGFQPSRSFEKVRKLTGDDEASIYLDNKLVQASYPWYLQPIHGGDEIKLEVDGMVTAGTLAALVERLTVEHLKPSEEARFRNVFYTTFKSFASAEEVFDLLVQRYNLEVPDRLTLAEINEWRYKRLVPTQDRVLNVLKFWLEEHGLIEDDPAVARRLQEFLSTIDDGNMRQASQVMQSLERMTFTIPYSPASAQPRKKRWIFRESKSELLRMDPANIAEHISLLQHPLYAKVRPQECLSWPKTREGDRVANLLAFCREHDRLATWVTVSILWTEKETRRADTVRFWIKVAENCQKMNNFFAMSAIVTALSSSDISKLWLTWAMVRETRSHEAMSNFNTPARNFASFREAQRSAKGPCVPFIAMYLTDIIHINDHQPNTIVTPLGTELINLTKRVKWCEVIQTMLAHQGKPYPYAQDATMSAFIEGKVLAAEQLRNMFASRSREVQAAERAGTDVRQGLRDAGF